MRYNKFKNAINRFQIPEARQQELRQRIEQAAPEQMSQVIMDVMSDLNGDMYQGIVEQIQADAAEAAGNQERMEQMGYRTHFNENESRFLQQVTSFTFTQDDVIPTEYIDRTMDSIRRDPGTSKLWKIAPASVKKWLTGTHTGGHSWGSLNKKLAETITAGITSMNMELGKLYLVLVVPKALKDLAMPYVDAYITAVLKSVASEGLRDGYLHGDGVDAPIGVLRQVNSTNSNGTKKYKTAEEITGFGAEELADILVKLTTTKNGDNDLVGNRAVSKIYIVANPADIFRYVNKALFTFVNGAWVSTSIIPVEIIPEPMCAATHTLTADEKTAASAAKTAGNVLSLYQDIAAAGTAGTTVIPGEAVITVEKAYTMGLDGVKYDEYKETLALDDANLYVGKAYANGRADDDYAAIPFDPTKLVKFVPEYKVVS